MLCSVKYYVSYTVRRENRTIAEEQDRDKINSNQSENGKMVLGDIRIVLLLYVNIVSSYI